MATPERRIIRFVSALLRGAAASEEGDGGFRVPAVGSSVRLDAKAIAALISQGVLRLENKRLRCHPEARAWLRRARSATDAAFADQHRIIAESAEAPQNNLNESPVTRLAANSGGAKEPFLAPHHVDAAGRLHRLFEKAQLRRSVTMSYEDTRAGSGTRRAPEASDISDMAVDARRRLERVWRALPRDCAIATYDICCLEKGLQNVEAEQGWPRRSAKLVLRIGLDQVAAHFGLSQIASGPETAGKRARKWRDDNARPTIVG